MRSVQKLKGPLFLKSLKSDNRLSKRTPLIKYAYLALLVSAINIGLVLISQRSLPPEVPLYYGLTKGEKQLTSSTGLIVPGLISLTIGLLNVSITLLLENDFLQKELLVSSFLVSIILFIASLKIILLVGSF